MTDYDKKIGFKVTVRQDLGAKILDRGSLVNYLPVCEGEQETMKFREPVFRTLWKTYGFIEGAYLYLYQRCLLECIITIKCIDTSQYNFVTYSPPWYYSFMCDLRNFVHYFRKKVHKRKTK